MKKIKNILFAFIAVCFFIVVSGCTVYASVNINDWSFTPQQANGTEIDLSLISGSEIEFDFTIKNKTETRALRASDFDVVFKNGASEVEALTIYFDNHVTSIDFIKNESRNIKLCVVSTSTISESDAIIIKFDDRVIVEYKLK